MSARRMRIVRAKRGHGSDRPRSWAHSFDAAPVEVNDGSQLYKVGDLGWLDFIDDHTAYLAMRPSLDAEHVHALAKRGAGVEASTRSLLVKLPAAHNGEEGHAAADARTQDRAA
jgi:hypothetical protein